jgi:hypothetical protein
VTSLHITINITYSESDIGVKVSCKCRESQGNPGCRESVESGHTSIATLEVRSGPGEVCGIVEENGAGVGTMRS